MEVEIISREVIKPSKPTPPHCKTYKISYIDQWMPRIYVPVLFFYQSPESIPQDNISKHLKSSLSNVLTHYYPFAGRVKDVVSIECNDEGVLFLEARVKNKLKLADILAQPLAIEPPLLNLFFPNDLRWLTYHGMDDTLLAVQLSHFKCGGFSIGICLSHKIADACTISNFVNDWATLTHQLAESTTIGPLLNTASLVPPDDQFPISPVPEMSKLSAHGHDFVTKRFVFPYTKILELKTIISRASSYNPTRVEAVNSVLFKSIVKGWNKSSPCIFPQAMNIRSRMATMLPNNAMGNFVGTFTVRINNDDNDCKDDVSLVAIVEKMREELKKSCDLARNTVTKDWISSSMKSITQVMVNEPTSFLCVVSSWCGYALYKTNFGMGKPIWVSTVSGQHRNSIRLLDAKDGHGIEAWVTLDAQHMASIQGDQELFKFAISNPSIA